MQIVPIKNHGNKLQSDVFVHIAPQKEDPVQRGTKYLFKDIDTDEKFPVVLLDRVDDRTLLDIEFIFCQLSHNCTRSELKNFFPNIQDHTPLTINIFKKYHAKSN